MTFEPTSSGTRHTHASRQDLPFFRSLKYHRVCGLQAGFPTLPGNDVLATRGRERMIWIRDVEIGSQKRGIQIALDRANPTGALMHPHRERFFDTRSTAVTKLAQFGGTCRDFEQGAARACNGAPQV